MFRGQYLSALDDLTDVLAVRSNVEEFGGQGRDEHDHFSTYAVVYNEDGIPFGCGRLYLAENGDATLDTIGVLAPYRRMFIGDLITGMLLSRAQAIDVPAIIARVPDSLLPYFSRYGFVTGEVCENVCGQPAHIMRIISNRVRYESTCAHDDVPMCTGDCAHCQRKH